MEQALKYFAAGYSCAQAVARAYATRFGLSEVDALRVASGFGGGLQRGDICGALTGAVLVLGLRYGPKDTEDIAAKKAVGAKVADFSRQFEARCGALDCRDLLGCDLGTAAGRAEFNAKQLSKSVCPKYVQAAVELLEEML